MKKPIAMVTSMVIFFLLLTNCKKEETPEEDKSNNTESKYTVQEYKLTTYVEGESVPTYTISSPSGEKVTYYCSFSSAGQPVKLTHYICEDGTDIAKIVSFDDEGYVNVVYNQNVLTDEVTDKAYVRSGETASYFTEGTETTKLETTGSFDLAVSYPEGITNDVIFNTLKKNELLFSRVSIAAGNEKRQFIGIFAGLILGAVIIDEIIDNAEEWFEDEDISEESLDELLSSVCTGSSGNVAKTSASSQYMCNETPEKEEERKNSTESDVELCGNNVCVADCNGEMGGTATIDECGYCVGGSTGRTECSEDCNGELGGIAFVDACDVCAGGSTGIVPNSTCEDCNGVIDGTAVFDECGFCVGGDTGKEPCEVDCNGDPGGTATEDQCGVCSGGNTNKIPDESCKDCNGVINGTAYIDNCDQCVGGNTGQIECNKDCNGVENGTATVDQCGVCSGGDTGVEPNECVDCNGEVFGSAYIDDCNECVGGGTGKQDCLDTTSTFKVYQREFD